MHKVLNTSLSNMESKRVLVRGLERTFNDVGGDADPERGDQRAERDDEADEKDDAEAGDAETAFRV